MHEWFKENFNVRVSGRHMGHPWWFNSKRVSIFPVTHSTLLAIDCCLAASFDVDGKIILKWIYRKWDEGAWTGSSWLRIGTGGGLL